MSSERKTEPKAMPKSGVKKEKAARCDAVTPEQPGSAGVAAGLDHDRGRAPQDGGGQLHRVTDQLVPRGQPQAVCERDRDPHERARQYQHL